MQTNHQPASEGANSQFIECRDTLYKYDRQPVLEKKRHEAKTLTNNHNLY